MASGTTEVWKGRWNEFKGMLREKWGQLTDNELTEMQGKREQLLGLIQKRYGMAKDEAERQMADLETRCGSCEP